MADKVTIAANVKCGALAVWTPNGMAGAAISAGDNLCKNADGTMGLLDANAVDPANKFVGVALNSAALGQPVAYATSDTQFTPGYPVAVGEVVIVSGTPGKSCPAADAVSGWFVTVLGVGIGGNKINLLPVAAGSANG